MMPVRQCTISSSNELCNVYVELVKPVLKSNDDPDVKEAARATLYVCLDTGLRLLHPIMPFITEELYQRLGRRDGDKTETISLAVYPDPDEQEGIKSWFDEGMDAKVDAVMKVTEGFLKIRGNYLYLGRIRAKPHRHTSWQQKVMRVYHI